MMAMMTIRAVLSCGRLWHRVVPIGRLSYSSERRGWMSDSFGC